MFFKSLIGDLNLAAKAISRTMSKQISSSQALVGCICIKVNMSEREKQETSTFKEGVEYITYCCQRKCFIDVEHKLYGIACAQCESFSFCRCFCKLHQERKLRELKRKITLLEARINRK